MIPVMSDFDAVAFGKRVEQAVADMGGSMRGVAVRIGITQGQLSKIIDGQQKRGVTLHQLRKLAEGLGKSEGWLIGVEQERRDPEEKIPARAHAIASMRAMLDRAIADVRQSSYAGSGQWRPDDWRLELEAAVLRKMGRGHEGVPIPARGHGPRAKKSLKK